MRYQTNLFCDSIWRQIFEVLSIFTGCLWSCLMFLNINCIFEQYSLNAVWSKLHLDCASTSTGKKKKKTKHFLLKIFFWGLCFSLGKIVKVSRVISNSSLCLWCITLKISIPYLTEPTVSLLGTLKSWLLFFSLVSLPIRHKLSVNWQTYYHFHLSLLV